MKVFGSRKLIKCVKELGFIFKRQTSSHQIFHPPKGRKSTMLNKNILPIQVGRNTYDSNACSRYVGQIKSFGFTKKEIEENL